MDKCEDCKFWDCIGDDGMGVVGYCRKYAPKPSLVLRGQPNYANDALWPLTVHTAWCGEFQPKEKEG